MAKLSLWLDIRKENRNGEYPIVLRLSHCGQTVHIATGVSIKKEDWNGYEVTGRENKELNTIVQYKLSDARLRLSKAGTDLFLKSKTAKEIYSIMYSEEEAALEGRRSKRVLFKDYYDMFLARKQKRKTIEGYEYMKSKLILCSDWDSLTFKEITVSFLRDWEARLKKEGCSQNTRFNIFTCVRALFNGAIDEDIIQQDCYPFRKFKYSKGETESKPLGVDEIRQLMKCDVEPHQKKYLDFFMLSFFMCGINPVDLLSLPKQDTLTSVSYRRSKTGVRIMHSIPDKAKEIIMRYPSDTHLVGFADSYDDYTDFLRHCNSELKRIGTVIHTKKKTATGVREIRKYHGLFPDITMYWARYSFATIAADLDIPDAVIDMALAHRSPYPMTDIYVRRNMKKIDECIERVIGAIFEE